MIDTKAKFQDLIDKTIRSEDLRERLPKQVVKAYAVEGERLATAVTNLEDAFYPSRLTRGAYETGTMTIYRSDVSAALTIPSGTVFRHMLSGEKIALDADLILDVAEQTGTVAWTGIEKRFTSLHKNSVMYLDATLSGVTYVVFGLVVTVAGVGKDDGLLEVGLIKNLTPLTGETDKAFRRRFRDVPDRVTYPACLAVVQKYFPTGTIIEGYERCGGALSSTPIVPGLTDDTWMYLDTGNALTTRDLPQAFFIVQIPEEVVAEQDLQWFTLGDVADQDAADSPGSHLGYTNFIGTTDTCDCFFITPIAGTKINPSIRTDVALMCAELNVTKAAGVSYIVEEV